MTLRPAAPALLALLALTTVAARADDAASLRGKVASAMNAAKSFVVTTTAATGFRVTTVVESPDRYHSRSEFNGAVRDVVVIGAVAYVSEAGQTYRKTQTPPGILAASAQLREIPVDRVLPDKVEGGKRWGQFATTSAGPQKDQRLVCTYDRTTYRIAECENEGLHLVFSRYDDPANAVSAPAKVAPEGSH